MRSSQNPKGEVRASVKACIGPPRQGQDRQRGNAHIVGYYALVCADTGGHTGRVRLGEGLGHRGGGGQEKSRAALGRGISEGARPNDELIVLPRRARAHTPMSDFFTGAGG